MTVGDGIKRALIRMRVTEVLGHGNGGGRPGLLIPAGDPELFAAALRSWLVDGELRQRLRAQALPGGGRGASQ